MTLADQCGRDFLQEVVEIGPAWFVGEEQSRDPAAVLFPETLELGVIGWCQRQGGREGCG